MEIIDTAMIKKILEKEKTSGGNEIHLVETGGSQKTILTIGVFHGDEPSGKYLIERYLKGEYKAKNRLLFVPCLNPDGLRSGTRGNSNGVDLNRNFPTKNWLHSEKDKYFGGDSPASETETSFVVEIIKTYKPDVILTLHEPYRIVNYDGPARDIAEKISKITKYDVEESIGYPTPGSFGTYCGVERGIPVITLEFAPTVDSEDADTQIVTPERLWCHYEKIMQFLADY